MASPKPWNVTLVSYIRGKIETEEVLLLEFHARREVSSEEPKPVLVRVESGNEELFIENLTIGKNWKVYRLPFKAKIPVEPYGGQVSFHLGAQAATIEVTGLKLYNHSYVELSSVGDPVK